MLTDAHAQQVSHHQRVDPLIVVSADRTVAVRTGVDLSMALWAFGVHFEPQILAGNVGLGAVAFQSASSDGCCVRRTAATNQSVGRPRAGADGDCQAAGHIQAYGNQPSEEDGLIPERDVDFNAATNLGKNGSP